MKKLVLIFYVIFINRSVIYCRGVDGGLSCAVCTVTTGILEQLAEIHSTDFINVGKKYCQYLPTNSTREKCLEAFSTIEPYIGDISEIFTPDVFCYTFGTCYLQQESKICNLFPMTIFQRNILVQKFRSSYPKIDFCKLPFLEEICNVLGNSLTTLEPGVDFDEDGFSTLPTIRGSDWRGRDCLDNDPTVYPGRRPIGLDRYMDSNCNGIWGENSHNGQPWEKILCSKSKPRGLIYIGDSIGAHFHMPEVWMNPLTFTWSGLNASYVTLDEIDWPQYGFATGFKNITPTTLIQGPTDSLYLRLHARNRCNHRDYQNLSQNGASSFDGPNHANSTRRNHTDYPVIVIFAMQGNDVCNNSSTIYNITKPRDFQRNVLETLKVLDNKLPEHSHVVLMGLVNADFVYKAMAHRVHPIGELHKNVRYNDVYNWFNCLEVGPCAGWLNSNETIRNITSQNARNLTAILRTLSKAQKFKNFKIHFIENPINQVLNNNTKISIPEFLESVDSLHPNQRAQPLLAEAVWESLLQLPPEVLGQTNPFNSLIKNIFGDQGGY